MTIFRCLCFVTNNLPHKKKDPRSFKCFFLGYLSEQKAYKPYDLINHKTYINRDIIFYQDIFPYLEYRDKNLSRHFPDNELSQNRTNTSNPIQTGPYTSTPIPTSPLDDLFYESDTSKYH